MSKTTAKKVKQTKEPITEAQVDDLRREFDWLCDHGQTKAKTFGSWLRRHGYADSITTK